VNDIKDSIVAALDTSQEETVEGRALAWELSQDIPEGCPRPLFAEACSRLQRLAKRHHRLQEHECNRGLSAKEQKKEARIEAQARVLVEALGWKLRVGGDPRGYTLKVLLPSGRYNTWGGAEEGWGI
jgi:hypothetical protein